MNTKTINENRTLTTVLHLSVFSKYFIPFGNFIFPMLLWLSQRKDPFVDRHGRNALNFQISTFLYTIFLVCVGVVLFIVFGLRKGMEEMFFSGEDSFVVDTFSDGLPFIITIGILAILFLGLFVLELFAVINASIKANEGREYKYPLTINFLRSETPDETNHHQNQSENEQFNDTQKQTL